MHPAETLTSARTAVLAEEVTSNEKADMEQWEQPYTRAQLGNPPRTTPEWTEAGLKTRLNSINTGWVGRKW